MRTAAVTAIRRRLHRQVQHIAAAAIRVICNVLGSIHVALPVRQAAVDRRVGVRHQFREGEPYIARGNPFCRVAVLVVYRERHDRRAGDGHVCYLGLELAECLDFFGGQCGPVPDHDGVRFSRRPRGSCGSCGSCGPCGPCGAGGTISAIVAFAAAHAERERTDHEKRPCESLEYFEPVHDPTPVCSS